MSNKFKVGDEVRLISNTINSDNDIGDVGIITVIGSVCPYYRVKVPGRYSEANWSHEDDIEFAGSVLDDYYSL